MAARSDVRARQGQARWTAHALGEVQGSALLEGHDQGLLPSARAVLERGDGGRARVSATRAMGHSTVAQSRTLQLRAPGIAEPSSVEELPIDGGVSTLPTDVGVTAIATIEQKFVRPAAVSRLVPAMRAVFAIITLAAACASHNGDQPDGGVTSGDSSVAGDGGSGSDTGSGSGSGSDTGSGSGSGSGSGNGSGSGSWVR